MWKGVREKTAGAVEQNVLHRVHFVKLRDGMNVILRYDWINMLI